MRYNLRDDEGRFQNKAPTFTTGECIAATVLMLAAVAVIASLFFCR